jgi:hypothetical protein
MLLSATVRVRPSAEGQDKPDRVRLEEAARLLEQFGFDVLRIGRFGIGVRGDHRDFLRVLGVNAEPNKPLSAAIEPSDRRLRDLVDLVEVTTNPKIY